MFFICCFIDIVKRPYNTTRKYRLFKSAEKKDFVDKELRRLQIIACDFYLC